MFPSVIIPNFPGECDSVMVNGQPVKNCEESEMILYLQTNKLAYYCFMDAGRRHKTSRPETKDGITQSTGGSVSIRFISIPLILKSHRATRVDAVHTVGLDYS